MTTDTNARPTTPAPRPAPTPQPPPPPARVSRRVVAWTITVGGLRVGWRRVAVRAWGAA